MDDIEDMLVGNDGAPPGFRLPVMSVGLNPKLRQKKKKNEDTPNLKHLTQDIPSNPSPQVPGTQTIYMKTFGCSHNQSDSEYMAGQLSAFGYALSDNPDDADLWLINTCTVKSPSQSAMDTLIVKCKTAKKPLVVAGCVPQGSRDIKELEGVSIVGVQQIDRVVEVVEETLKGHEVRLLTRKTLPALDLPKVRKNKFIEILPINVGCLGACTYCKTKHARGHLGSYTIDGLVERVKAVAAHGVKEIWLSSEDTGAYGRDIGTNLPTLLNAIVAVLPPDRSTMLRIGMTNPPFILEHLKEIAAVLSHPCVYSFLHVPVQSGSDPVLTAMHREYTVSEFKKVVDTLLELVPGMHIATDIICGFPGETDENFAETVNLVKEYKFPQVHISQFYPRPGTPAARMKKVPSAIVKKRSRELTSVFESFTPYQGMEGQIERIWITEIATDGVHLVGHTKGYIQVLVIAPEAMLGTSTDVKITSVGRWSVFGEVIDTPKSDMEKETGSRERKSIDEKMFACSGVPTYPNESLPCSDMDESCACSREPEPCACAGQSCGESNLVDKTTAKTEDGNRKNLIGWLLRKRKVLNGTERLETKSGLESEDKQDTSKGNTVRSSAIDRALLVAMLISFLTILGLLVLIGFRIQFP
ncbi:threonylcarbamoyladenosine tRNA methylthiotransferase-like [Papaver somniferum]|uniref:threonylcarbamoyladenosine tRNA methylthiotransferase-like n=1 Tax=Papaver somniferum TaxID=3469 RepID=UPI000E6F59D6|nr:threonylcarbamoyladenosine tRNA methylthiotransferase-like [Papaver somniferum]